MAGPYPYDRVNEVVNTDDHKVPVSADFTAQALADLAQAITGGGTTITAPNRTAINTAGETVLRTVAANGNVTFHGVHVLAGQTNAVTLTVKDSSTSSMAGNDLISPVDTTMPESDLRENGIICQQGIVVGLTTPAMVGSTVNGSTTLTVTSTSIVLTIGQNIYIDGETSTRTITAFGTGTGGAGTYTMGVAATQTASGKSISVPAVNSPTITGNITNGSTTLTVTATSIVIAVGQTIYVPGETTTRTISALGTGTGGTGTYTMSAAATQTITGVAISTPVLPVPNKIFVEWS